MLRKANNDIGAAAEELTLLEAEHAGQQKVVIATRKAAAKQLTVRLDQGFTHLRLMVERLAACRQEQSRIAAAPGDKCAMRIVASSQTSDLGSMRDVCVRGSQCSLDTLCGGLVQHWLDRQTRWPCGHKAV